MKWENSNFFPNKYQNLHECELFVMTSMENMNSIDSKIIKLFGKLLHFEIHFKINPSNSSTLYNEFDLIDSGEFFDQSAIIEGYPYTIFQITIFVPPGELYSSLEKLFLPFDFATWLAILLTLAIGLATIQVVNFCTIKVKSFIFGSGFHSPTINLSAIFLNGGQHFNPGRNFARILLILFVIWCLVIRTCYQSELFKCLQTDRRKPAAKTILQLLERNFTFNCYDDLRQIVDDIAAENGIKK